MVGSLSDQMKAYYDGAVDGSSGTSLSDTNVVTTPAANAVLATVTASATGVYQVEVTSFIGGTTVAATEINNMRLRVNGVAVGRVINPVPGTTGAVGIGGKRARIAATAGQVIDVIAVGLATTGAIYGCDLVASRVA
jgi:hypothetical protein